MSDWILFIREARSSQCFYFPWRARSNSSFSQPQGSNANADICHYFISFRLLSAFRLLSRRAMSMFVYAAEPEVAPADEPQAVAEGLL